MVRGFIVALAMLEHFSMILNSWYLDYFSVNDLYSFFGGMGAVELYQHHNSYLGNFLPVDTLFLKIGIIFIPWLTHLFIALSGYNLARKTRKEARDILLPSLKNYFFFFLLFFLEQFIVAPDFGYALNLFPITLWFILLAICHLLYVFVGIRGLTVTLLLLTCLNMLQNSVLIDLPGLSNVTKMIHPWARNCSEPLSYLPDCLLGMVLGYIYHQKIIDNKKTKIILLISFIICVGSFFIAKDLFQIDAKSVVLYDETLQKSNSGIIYIISIVAFILTLVHLFRDIRYHPIFGLFQWIAINSLGLFLIHRILFLKIFAPIRLHIGSYFGLPMSNSSWELLFLFLPLTLISYKLFKNNKAVIFKIFPADDF